MSQSLHQQQNFSTDNESDNMFVGAKSASNPAEIAANTDRIITMLPASKHVQEVYTGNNGIFR